MYVNAGAQSSMYLAINVPVVFQELHSNLSLGAGEGDIRKFIRTPEVHDLLREHRDFPAHQKVLKKKMY